MATHINNSLGVPSSDASLRRVSAPHIPFHVVVTDVNGQIQNSGDDPQGLFCRLSQNQSRVNGKREAPINTISSWGSTEKMAKKDPHEQERSNKPATQWRKISRLFNALKMMKKKDCPTPSQLMETEAMSLNKPTDPAPSLRLSPRSSISISPARSESDFYMYDMASISDILSVQDVKTLGKNFPPSAVGCPCVLTFSTSDDGYCLHTLYRKVAKIDSPVIIAIQDIQGRTFGALLSCALKVSEHFYGSSESFLFRCGPSSVEIFKWREGGNRFFIHSEENFLRIGAGGGKCGLWLDDNLFHGRTEECATFESPPLVEEQDFQIKTVECWTFGQI